MTGEESLVLCTYIRPWELVTNIRSVGNPASGKIFIMLKIFLTDKEILWYSYLIFLYRVSVAELSCHLFAPSTNFPPFRTTPSRHFRTPFLLSFLDSIVDDDRRPSTTDPSTCPFNQTMTSHGDGRQWQHQPMTKSTALSTACPAGLSSVKMYLDT